MGEQKTYEIFDEYGKSLGEIVEYSKQAAVKAARIKYPLHPITLVEIIPSLAEKFVEEKGKAENRVRESLREIFERFQETTGMSVAGIEVEMICANQLDSIRNYQIGNVKLELNLEDL